MSKRQDRFEDKSRDDSDDSSLGQTGCYSFDIQDGLVSSVFESKGSFLKAEKIDINETYSLQADGTVLKQEIEKNGIETTVFKDLDNDGFFDKIDHNWMAKTTQTLTQKVQKGWYEISGKSLDYDLVSDNGLKSLISSRSNESESIEDAKRVLFEDKSLAFGTEAETVAKLLGAVFGSEAVANKEYAGIGLSLLDSGMSRDDLAELAAKAAGLDDHREVVSTLWSNLFHKEGSDDELNEYVDMLDDGMSVSALVLLAADTDLNTDNINLIGIRHEGLEFHG